MKNQIKKILFTLLLLFAFQSTIAQVSRSGSKQKFKNVDKEQVVSDSTKIALLDSLNILKYAKKSDLLSDYPKTSEVNSLDSQNVKITGDQSIIGEKNFENIKITNQVPAIDFYSTNEALSAKIEYNGSGEVFDFSDDIFLRGSLYLFGDNKKITNIQSVTSDTDAANKIYVDNLDSQNVKLTGDQSKSGKMTFTDEVVLESGYSIIRLKEAGVNKGAIGRDFAGQSATSKGMWFTNATNKGLWLSETDNELYYRDTFDQFLLLNEDNFGKQEIEDFGFVDGQHISDNSQIANGEGYTTNTGTTTPDNTQTFTNKSGSNSQWTNDEEYLTDASTQTKYQLKSEKDANSGYAGLDSAGKINPLQLPALAITETFVVANQSEMLAIDAQRGDVAVRTDINKSLILTTDDPTVLANWQELLTPTDQVASVFGRAGTVTAQNGDYTKAQVGLSNVPNTNFTSEVTANNAKISFDNTSSSRLANTSGTNTGDGAPSSGSGSYIQNQDAVDQVANLKINGTGKFGSNVELGGNVIMNGSSSRITGLNIVTDDTDAVNKIYVDNLNSQNVKITGDQDVAGVKNFTNFLRTRNLVINGASGGYSSGDNPMFAFGNNPTSGGFGVVEMPFGQAMKFTSYHGYRFDVSAGTGSGVNALDIMLSGVADFKFNVKAPSLDVSGDLTAVNGTFSEELTLTDESYSISIGTDALTKFIIRNAGPSSIIKSLKDNFYIQANGPDSKLRIEAQKSIYISSGGVLSMAITPGAGVNLRYNGDSRFTTTSSGGTLVGTLKTDNATITDGSLILQSTGRLQGIDVVSAGTDATSKDYVDNAIAGTNNGTPAILSDGTVPSLNSGIIGTEIRDLIGAGTVKDVRAGSGMTQTGDPEEDTILNVIGGSGIVANADSIEVDGTVIRTTNNSTLSGGGSNKIVIANTNGTLSTRAGYKVYIAKISQFFTNNVSAQVLENTFSSVPTWSRSSVGVYKLNSSASEFTGNKTTYSINQSASDAIIVISKGTAVTDEILFRTRNIDTNSLQDASILNATIEVRVYN
jgi:hypothetical protein